MYLIGPSSSHTAGALKIALMARHIIAKPVVKVHFRLYGSFARTYSGHGTDRALIAGMLGYDTEDKRIRDAYHYAEEAGLEVRFSTNTTNQDIHPNTVKIIAEDVDGREHTIVGESVGGGEVVLRRLDGLLVKHIDRPGALAFIATCTSQWGINIAALRMHREAKGETAYAEMTIDTPAPESLIHALQEHPLITEVTQIRV